MTRPDSGPNGPDFNIEIGVDGDDHLVAVKPPVEDVSLREMIYDELDELGLLKEALVRGGSFFDVRHLSDGSLYSELRISGTALAVAGQTVTRVAHLTADILRKQQKTAEVSPYLVAAGGTRKFFEDLREQGSVT